ncbi:putative basic amino acid antiporter YfcC [Subdoligranulum variabile]|uniref:C4-dicarboxylate anaerobic carrier n=1 Tax=Subdoligranulum variabile DSM 15176 TaxID=411471 RepID=D1PPG1_9FIRM|nr:C4-dicarboxylate anaerobic carrier [Subdoligranulum variabile DSM 15176]
MEKQKKKTIQMPHTYVIIFAVVVLCAVLTYLIPVGSFQTQEISYMMGDTEKTRTVIVADSFTYAVDEAGNRVRSGVPLFGTEDFGGQGMLNYVFEGLTSGDKNGSAVGIVAFILVIGGAFGIVMRTGAVDAGIHAMIRKTKGREIILIPVLFTLFSLGGAVFGMGEEAIPFAMVIVPLTIAMGYDAVVAVCVTYVATQIGFGTSWMNPFGLAIAQGIAGVPVLSGAGFRIVMWAVFTLAGVLFTMAYARKIKKNPQSSVAYESDAYYRNQMAQSDAAAAPFTLGQGLVLVSILVTIVWTVWGVVVEGYYIPEIASQFFVMGLVAGIIGCIFHLNGMRPSDMASSFQSGAADLVGAALVVGMAQGIVIVLGGTDPTTPSVMNTILYTLGNLLSGVPGVLAAWLMYVFQSLFNFVVVSGSGQAALTMPIMAPLADLAGITRQVAVLAYQLGDGLTNLIVPTSGCLLGVLGVARLEWGKWAKFQIKMQGMLFVLSTIFVVVAVMIGFA